jgi:hypothetical protein
MTDSLADAGLETEVLSGVPGSEMQLYVTGEIYGPGSKYYNLSQDMKARIESLGLEGDGSFPEGYDVQLGMFDGFDLMNPIEPVETVESTERRVGSEMVAFGMGMALNALPQGFQEAFKAYKYAFLLQHPESTNKIIEPAKGWLVDESQQLDEARFDGTTIGHGDRLAIIVNSFTTGDFEKLQESLPEGVLAKDVIAGRWGGIIAHELYHAWFDLPQDAFESEEGKRYSGLVDGAVNAAGDKKEGLIYIARDVIAGMGHIIDDIDEYGGFPDTGYAQYNMKKIVSESEFGKLPNEEQKEALKANEGVRRELGAELFSWYAVQKMANDLGVEINDDNRLLSDGIYEAIEKVLSVAESKAAAIIQS